MATPALDAQVLLAAGRSGDLDDVMIVMESAFGKRFGEAWTRSQCAGILPMHGVSLLLARDFNDGKTLGFSLTRTVAGESELLLLAVLPSRQREGIGARLLDDFIDRSRAERIGRLHLEVREGNPAVAMYHDAGFRAVGRRRNYYHATDGEHFDALTLVREL